MSDYDYENQYYEYEADQNEDFQNELNDTLIYYHYCLSDTFLKIIETGKIRLCNPYKMNDSEELKWSFNLLADIVENYISEISDEEIRSKYKYYYKEAVQGIFQEYYLDQSAPHIACFSENGDMLSQWRAYANDGKGMSIGLEISKLINSYKDSLIFRPICYDIERQKEQLLLKMKENGLDDAATVNFHRMKHLVTACMDLVELLLPEALCYKNPAFLEEKEGHLIYLADEDINSSDTPVNISGRFYRSTEDNLVTYYELDFSKILSEVIKSIYIGPKSKVTKYDVESLLSAKIKPYNEIGVFKSSATYTRNT